MDGLRLMKHFDIKNPIHLFKFFFFFFVRIWFNQVKFYYNMIMC